MLLVLRFYGLVSCELVINFEFFSQTMVNMHACWYTMHSFMHVGSLFVILQVNIVLKFSFLDSVSSWKFDHKMNCMLTLSW